MKKMKIKSNSSKSRKRKIIDTIAILGLSCIVIVSLFGFMTLNVILKESEPFKESLLQGDQATVLYAKNSEGEDEVFHQLSSGDGIREDTSYNQLPQVVVDAFLAVEDSRFFKHNGFDLPRFLKSALENLKAGGFAQGGSTLTMQMIDVTHGTTTQDQNVIEKLIAKVQEIFMALDAESYLSKQNILVSYLNNINFGGPARGIQKGAQYYFGKDISEVNLSEAAFLAGVINAPNAYNPYLNYENAVARRNNALQLMVNHGYISETEYQLAKDTELAFQLGGTSVFEGLPFQSAIDYIAWYCDEYLGIDIYQGNMKIYTTFDIETQQMYDGIMNGDYGWYKDAQEGLQSGSALVDVENGSIVALAGGLNYSGDVRHNYAYDPGLARQTGSSIKPLLDYTLAFEVLGWSTEETIADVPMYYRGTKLQLFNAGGQYHGDVSLSDAIAHSWNIPAATALQKVIDATSQKYVAEKMVNLGLETFQDIYEGKAPLQIGMSIGGSEMVATPLQMAAAYAALANGGVYTEPYAITKIEFLDGSREDYIHEPISRQVFSPQASYLMSEMLVKAVSNYSGTFQSVMQSPYQVATKTGTSDWADLGLQYGIPLRAAKDKWTVSYTTKYSIATWMGFANDENNVPYGYLTDKQMNKNIPTKINKKIFDAVHKDNRPSSFKQPSGIVSISHLKGAFEGGGHYAAPEGTPKELISTGKVISKFASLKQLKLDDIQALSSFTATVNSLTNKVDFAFTPYPDAEALKEFDGKYHGVVDFPNYEGPKIFDNKLVYGPIAYKVEVFQNGVSLGIKNFTTELGSDDFDITPGTEAKVCGFYGYTNDNKNHSNQVCVTLPGTETQKLQLLPVLPELPQLPQPSGQSEVGEPVQHNDDTIDPTTQP